MRAHSWAEAETGPTLGFLMTFDYWRLFSKCYGLLQAEELVVIIPLWTDQ